MTTNKMNNTRRKAKVEEVAEQTTLETAVKEPEKKPELTAESLKKKIASLEEKEKEQDRRPITGTFKNFQSPGLDTVFSCKKYKDEKITTYRLRDGEVTTLPYYVAKMLRQECYYKRNQRFQSTNGQEDIKIGAKVKLMDFYPHNEFIEGTEQVNSLVTVESRR